ncbi:MAG: L-lysine 6-transaminase [Planctomycetes bacterium]|nr:L-lysine 6-transaminase [Planctomycetota bacterium]
MTRIAPAEVHGVLGRHILTDGFDFVLDLEGSRCARLRDARTGRTFLDFFSFFASAPVGHNHPKMADARFREKLLRAALTKVSNSDVYTVEMAEFVEAFSRVAIPKDLPHAFFVEGGTLGVENAIKAAFDWKVRANLARGKGEKGSQVVHFEQAFHGRGGYTLSMTNTFDPNKTKYYPKFVWPRIESPKMSFPADGARLEETVAAEKRAVKAIEAAFQANPGDIAAILIEPVQGEGGDNQFRPEFFRELRRLADENEAMLIFDEVQTGVGITGRMWAYEHTGVVPDMVCFAKKMQVGGFLCGRRIENVADNVFKVPSRINSTWGGNLVDMVRATRFLEIIEQDRLVDHAAARGEDLLAGLRNLAARHPGRLSNARGLGLMCAVDLPTTEIRDRVRKAAYDRGLIVLGCGSVSIRFRPVLDIAAADLAEGLKILEEAVLAG